MKSFEIEPFKGKYSSLLIFGPPGVGKGTLCKFLATSNSLVHISSGDIFRGISSESSAGRLIKEHLSKGLLLPDAATIAIWKNYVSGLSATNRFYPEKQILLLDGIPRTKIQADLLKEYIDVKGIIILDVPNKEILLKRLQGRAIVEKRSDDADLSVLQKRMEVYEQETKQVLESYSESLYYKVNAEGKPLEVLRDVLCQVASLIP